MPDVDQECPACRGRCGSRGTVYGIREGHSFCEEQWLACSICGGKGRMAVDAGKAYEQERRLYARPEEVGLL